VRFIYFITWEKAQVFNCPPSASLTLAVSAGRRLNQQIVLLMCDKCFNSEISSFATAKEYLDFDLLLSKKLANEKTVKHVRLVKTSEIQIDTRDYEDLGYNVYECIICGQLWGLHDPDNADRGYFKKITGQTVSNDIKAMTSKKNSGCFILLLFLLLPTIFWLCI
jgi:hypothetical protein